MCVGVQEVIGVEMESLVEDAQNASVSVIAAEAFAKLAAGMGGPEAAQSLQRSTWISPAPSSVKLRLFCLPYAGGISENVYSRCGKNVLRPWPARLEIRMQLNSRWVLHLCIAVLSLLN